jgi:hypothetical protein
MRHVHALHCLVFLHALSGHGAGLLMGIVREAGWPESCRAVEWVLQREIAGFLQAVQDAYCVAGLSLAGICMLLALLALLASEPSSPE